jgi:ABC-type multidrug transport system fused ATPase/permease subunit
VFENINLEIKPKEKISFVGPSGCGKSTIIQLLQRFYFFEKGNIFIDGIDIKDYSIHHLRNKFGVVSQEPTLFNGTFR